MNQVRRGIQINNWQSNFISLKFRGFLKRIQLFVLFSDWTMSWGKTFLNLSHKFVSVASPNKCHRILPQMSHITKKLYWAKKTNFTNDTSIFQLARRFPAINNVKQWNATLKMYQSDEVLLCCRQSYLRLFLLYVRRLISFTFLFVLKSFLLSGC